jgi:DNA-directed RNA polymerase specialized sigma24 family protein
MPEKFTSSFDSLIPSQPLSPGVNAFDGLDDLFDQIAAGLYSIASMLVGEGEDGARLVETAIATADIAQCSNPTDARQASRRALAGAALELLEQRDSGSLAAPDGLEPALTCIEDDDLDAAGSYGEELERMISGPDRDRVRTWLESLPASVRTIFVLRAVVGFSASETADLLAAHGGEQAAGWTPDAVREFFRQGLCSLASHLLQEAAPR